MSLQAFCPFISYFKIHLNKYKSQESNSLLKENILISLLCDIALQYTFLLLFPLLQLYWI